MGRQLPGRQLLGRRWWRRWRRRVVADRGLPARHGLLRLGGRAHAQCGGSVRVRRLQQRAADHRGTARDRHAAAGGAAVRACRGLEHVLQEAIEDPRNKTQLLRYEQDVQKCASAPWCTRAYRLAATSGSADPVHALAVPLRSALSPADGYSTTVSHGAPARRAALYTEYKAEEEQSRAAQGMVICDVATAPWLRSRQLISSLGSDLVVQTPPLPRARLRSYHRGSADRWLSPPPKPLSTCC